ncbi:hypothetical protein QUH45_24295, partial [Klebsiella grimontii]
MTKCALLITASHISFCWYTEWLAGQHRCNRSGV